MEKLSETDSVKYLGIQFDKNVTCKQQIKVMSWYLKKDMF